MGSYLFASHSQLALHFYRTVLPGMRPFLLESAGPVHTFATVPISILLNVTVTCAGQDLNSSGRSYKHLPGGTTNTLRCSQSPPCYPPPTGVTQGLTVAQCPVTRWESVSSLLVCFCPKAPLPKAVCTLILQRALKAFSLFISAISAGKHGGVPGSDFHFVLFSIQYFLCVSFLPLKSAY